jgi:ribosomal protein S18 acetylase RimI-like enzyme
VRVREATPEDWPAIWSFARLIWAAGDTFAYDEAMDEAEARAIWMVDPPGRTTVAVGAEGGVIGSANMYANRPGPGAHVASGSFIVDPGHQGRGTGRALCEDALDWARAQGFRGMQFNAVAASNEHAVGLYRSLGFEVVGTVPEGFRHPRQGYVDLLIMHRPL